MTRFVLLFLAACAVPATGTHEQAIINGDPAPDDDAVVMLVGYPADRSTMFTCTASVIAPTALLTGAHCIDHAGFSYGVFYGADAMAYPTLADLLPQLAPVASVVMNPSYSRDVPFTADIAIVTLANPAPVTPLPFARTAPTHGADARIVGYGQRQYGTFNAARYQAMTRVAAVDPGDTITVGDATHRTCIGDSGGPAFVVIDGVETVVGVNSYGPVGCTDPAHFRRTDLYQAFIDAEAGTSPPDPVDDPPPNDDESEDGGGCAAGGHGAGLAFGLLLALAIVRRSGR